MTDLFNSFAGAGGLGMGMAPPPVGAAAAPGAPINQIQTGGSTASAPMASALGAMHPQLASIPNAGSAIGAENPLWHNPVAAGQATPAGGMPGGIGGLAAHMGVAPPPVNPGVAGPQMGPSPVSHAPMMNHGFEAMEHITHPGSGPVNMNRF